MQNDLKNDPRYQNHESRPDLAGEHPVGDTWQGIGMLAFIVAALLDYFLLGNPQHFNQLISFWARLPFSLALFGLGAWLALHGIQVVFGEYREEPIMITNDLFAYMRHPVYLGAILLYVAVLLLVLSPLAGLVLLVVLGIYQWLAKYEENRMIGIFGERYKEYQRRVPMWLPIKFNK